MAEPGVVTPEGHKYFLEIIFTGKKPVENLWVGLCKRPTGKEDLAGLTKLEPKDTTYKRLRLTPNDWRVEGSEVVSKQVVYSNFSSNPWPGVDASFVTTSEDEKGILLFWNYLRTSRGLLSGDELWFPVRIGLLGRADVRV